MRHRMHMKCTANRYYDGGINTMEKEQKFNILRGIVISSYLENEQKTELIDFVKRLEKEAEGWFDSDIEVPTNDKYVLLSFSNFSVPLVGRYEEDKNGGAFYIGDETETCSSQDIFVNAWMPLPEPYRTE